MSPFERLSRIMFRPWFVVCYFSFVVLSFFYFDRSIAWFFHGLNMKKVLPLASILTKFAVGEIHIIVLFSLVIFFRYIRPNKTWETRAWFLWLCVTIPYIICGFLKIFLGRARPQLLFSDQLYGFYGLHFHPPYWSFPSGHTTTVSGFVLGLIILFPRYCYAFFFAGLVVISTRVLLTNHYLSDVMTTGYLTFVEVALLVYVLRRKGWLSAAFLPNNA